MLLKGVAVATGASGGLTASLASTGAGIKGFLTSLASVSLTSIMTFVAISGALALSIAMMGISMKTFSDVSWESMAKGVSTIVAFGVIAGLMGSVAGYMITGAIALGVLGVALILNATAFLIFSKAITPFTTAISNLYTTVGGGGLISILSSLAIGIGLLGASLGSFGVVSMIAIPSMIVTTSLLNGLSNVIKSLNGNSLS
jgi:hypothetical protein